MASAGAPLLVLLAILVSILAAACSGASEAGNSVSAASAPTPEGDLTQPRDAEPVADELNLRVADTGTGYQWINNAILKFVLEEGYGYNVEVVSLDSSQMQAALASGDVQINLEVRSQDAPDWFEAETKGGNIVSLGDLYQVESLATEKIVHKSLEETHPDVVKLLRKMSMPLETLKKIAAWANANGITDGNLAALYYLQVFDFDSRYKSWMPNKMFREVVNSRIIACGNVNWDPGNGGSKAPCPIINVR